MKVKYFKCMHCGNIIEKITDKGVPVMCCGEPMKELIAGKTDAAVEKHVPVYTVAGNHVHVAVGETEHPMIEAHYTMHLYAAASPHVPYHLHQSKTNQHQHSHSICFCTNLLTLLHLHQSHN